MTKEQKINIVRNFLLEFTDPKPKHDGMTAYSMAVKIVEALEKSNEEEK